MREYTSRTKVVATVSGVGGTPLFDAVFPADPVRSCNTHSAVHHDAATPTTVNADGGTDIVTANETPAVNGLIGDTHSGTVSADRNVRVLSGVTSDRCP